MAKRIQKNNGKTHLEIIEKKYGKDLGIKGGKQLDSYLIQNGYSSLIGLLEFTKGRQISGKKQ